MVKVGYLGPAGSFSQEALCLYTKGDKHFIEKDFCTISDLIQAVDKEEVDEALVPLENSIEGGVNTSLDMMAFDVNLCIKSEVIMPICQNLLVSGGTKKGDIKCIVSHPQAIGQCRSYIDKNFKGVGIEYIYSTSGAAQEAAVENGYAAIGSKKAGEVYGLNLLETNIQDRDDNYTRFVVLSHEDSMKPTGNDKTSVVFSTEDKPGSLYRILDILNLYDINMTRIESRPAKSSLGSYIFFIDLLGHRLDEDAADALTMIRRKTSFFKLLGSYPIYSGKCVKSYSNFTD